jgi:hypothetical protein
MKNENNRTAWAMNELVGMEMFKLDAQAESRWEFWKDHRYTSPEGYLYSLYNIIRFTQDEEGTQLYGPERFEYVQQAIHEEVVTRNYWDEVDRSRNSLMQEIANLPEGSPGWVRQEKYQAHWDHIASLEGQPSYDPAARSWFVGYKPARLVMQDIEAQFWQTAMSLLPPYDPEKETYVEYMTRKDEFLATELPNIAMSSTVLWEKLDSIEYLDESVNGVDNIMARLLQIANPEGYDAYKKSRDTVDDALFHVWEDKYYDLYWKMVEGKKNEEWSMAERQFYNMWSNNPLDNTREVGPQTQDLVGWVQEAYPSRWTDAEILEAINPQIYSAQERRIQDQLKNRPEDIVRVEERAWEIVGAIPPGKNDEFMDAYREAGGNEDLLTGMYNKDLEFVTPALIQDNMTALQHAAKTLGFDPIADTPTSELELRSSARDDNDLFKKFIDAQLYAGFYEEYAKFNGQSYAWQSDYREAHPQFAEAAKKYADLKKEFATSHPNWAKYYMPEGWEEAKKSSGGGGGSGSRGASGYSTSAKATEIPHADIRFGKRTTLDVRNLLEPGRLGRGGTGGKFVWPTELREMAGPDLIASIESGEPLTDAEKKLIEWLKSAKGQKYRAFMDTILELNKQSDRRMDNPEREDVPPPVRG